MPTYYPTTMAVRFLRERGVAFTPHIYRWEGGGALGSAKKLGVSPRRIGKTLIFVDDTGSPLCVVMNGDFEVAVKQLARTLGRKHIDPAPVSRAEALTGYQVGGISPFGQRTSMPILMQLDLFEFDTIFVNGGKRGFLMELAPAEIEQALAADVIDAAVRD